MTIAGVRAALTTAMTRCFGSERRSLYTLVAIGLFLYVIWVRALPMPLVLSSVDAVVGRVQFVVTGRDLGAIPVGGMRATAGGLGGRCVAGLLVPDVGAEVGYERQADGSLSVLLIRGGARFEFVDAQPAVRQSGGTEFIADRRCGEDLQPRRLPIWGRLRLGTEMRPSTGLGEAQSGMLLEGKLLVQARALTGWLSAFGPPTVYAAAEVVLPVGSRVEARHFDGRDATWWGSVEPHKDRPALTVQAATETRELALFRPLRPDADIVTVSTLTQVFTDPNIVRVQIFVGVVLALLGLAATLAPLVSREPRRDA